MGLVGKVFDVILFLWLLRNHIFTVFIEIPWCKYGSDWVNHKHENMLLNLTYSSLVGVDPASIECPTYLQAATCAHVYMNAPLYFLIQLSLVFGFYTLGRYAALFVAPLIINGVIVYALWALYFAEKVSPDPFTWCLYNLDYVFLSIALLWRFRHPSAPIRKKGKKN